MKNIEITNLNKNKYQKLLEIKQGKRVPNDKCVWIPSFLLCLEGFGSAILILWSTFLDPYMPILLADLIQLILYGIVLFGITKVNFELSKKMGVHYFSKEHPDINVDISTKELKQKLIQYKIENTPKRRVRELERSGSPKKTTSKEKLKYLKNEKAFWTKYKDDQKEVEKDKVIKKKF